LEQVIILCAIDRCHNFLNSRPETNRRHFEMQGQQAMSLENDSDAGPSPAQFTRQPRRRFAIAGQPPVIRPADVASNGRQPVVPFAVQGLQVVPESVSLLRPRVREHFRAPDCFPPSLPSTSMKPSKRFPSSQGIARRSRAGSVMCGSEAAQARKAMVRLKGGKKLWSMSPTTPRDERDNIFQICSITVPL
jgi:hypothetical protein